ncbi:MAG: hypothetical protein AAF950_18115 [Pseudomonadota bacterium]
MVNAKFAFDGRARRRQLAGLGLKDQRRADRSITVRDIGNLMPSAEA